MLHVLLAVVIPEDHVVDFVAPLVLYYVHELHKISGHFVLKLAGFASFTHDWIQHLVGGRAAHRRIISRSIHTRCVNGIW